MRTRFLMALTIVLCMAAVAEAQVVQPTPPTKFGWNANTEVDLMGYNIYTCPTTVLQANCKKAGAVKIGTIGKIAIPTFPLPVNQAGWAFVTAFNTQGFESGESNTVGFKTVVPLNPVNLQVVP